MANKLHRQVKGLAEGKSDKLNLISGNLGISIDGQRTVEVPNRDGYVWVRLRGNQSELIQAYNSAVSPIFDLPVLVVRSNNRYSVYGRDIEKYGDWGNSPYLPKHGTQHSFNPELGMGGDVTWIYSRQFVPLLATPSGSAGAASLVINPHIYREPSDGSFTYIGNQGTPDATLAKPTDNQARMMLLYWDLNTNLPNMITGSLFDASITGTAQITPYIPALNDSEKIPLSAIRVVSGTTTIDWDNIYDIRQFATTTPPAFQGGFGIWDEGIPQGTGTILNFIGAGIDATVSGTVAQIVVTATGGGGTSSPWTTGSAGTNSIKAVGGGSNATGDYAVAHGQSTYATGTASTAEGLESVAQGDYSHAEGNGTLAKGDESHAEGYGTVAIGLDSHAEGQSSISSGTASHAEGQGNLAAGFASHAGGSGNKARGNYSAVIAGIGNSALGEGSVVLGGFEVTGSASYTAYVDRLHIQRLQTGTSIANLGMDSQGYIVTGTTGGGGGLTYTATTVTTGNVTAVSENFYDCTIAGMTADRDFNLPTPAAAGERIALRVLDGDNAFELIIKANSVEITRVFIANEYMSFVSTGTGAGDWKIEVDGRVACLAVAERQAAQAILHNTVTLVEIDTAIINRGDLLDVSSGYRATARRAGYVDVTVYTSIEGIDDGERIQARIYKNGSLLVSNTQWSSTPVGNANLTALVTKRFSVAVGDYIQAYIYHDEDATQNTVTASPPYLEVEEIL